LFTVALTGPDGAGKTTIGKRLETALPLPIKYIYMGINLDSSNLVLPTTRLILEVKRALGRRPDMAGPADPTGPEPRPRGALKQAAAGVKSGLRLANRIGEEWFRQVLAWYYRSHGYIVLFDRHFFSDYYAADIAPDGRGRPLTSRIHGFMLKRLYPKPDLVIYLDAPPEVLFARKGEGSLESLQRRREEYLQLRGLVRHFAVVDANRPEDEVTHDVADLVQSFYNEKVLRK